MLQRFTLDKLHDEKVHAILMPDVIESVDVRMQESGFREIVTGPESVSCSEWLLSGMSCRVERCEETSSSWG